MADTYTTNLNLTKPEPGAAEDTWGISLNADLDALDAIFSSSGTQINLNPNQINFADGKKAVFGNSSDLQIYHDGSHSYVSEGGTGNLKILADNLLLQRADQSQTYIQALTGGAVDLRHAGNVKLATSSSGIIVTGTTVTDGLTVSDGTNGIIQVGALNTRKIAGGADYGGIRYYSDNDHILYTNNVQRLAINSGGDISFYDDTGSSQSFFWDASAEKLAIGTTTTNAAFTVNHALPSGQPIAEFRSTGNSNATIDLRADGTGDSRIWFDLNGVTPFAIGVDNSDGDKFKISGNYQLGTNDRFVIDASGNVMLGKTSVDAGATQGFEFRADLNDLLYLARAGNAITLNRLSSDGDIALFRKDGSTVGSIGTVSGDLNIFASASGHKGLRLGAGFIAPTSNSTTIEDATTDLGISTARFRHLHLSGTANVNTIASTGDLTLDAVTNINLDADGGAIRFKDGGTSFGEIFKSSSNMILYSTISNGDMKFMGVDGGNNITALTLDMSNGGTAIFNNKVGIGTTSPALQSGGTGIHVNGTSYSEIKFTNSTTGTASTDGTALVTVGTNFTINNRENGYFSLNTNNSERLRVDSSGNLLVGKTSSGIANVGVESRQNGLLFATADGSDVLKLNRLTSDGAIQEFRKDGSTVGSIASKDGDMTIGTGDTGIRFYDGGNGVYPVNASTRAGLDATIDLGRSDSGGTFRFKDLHLSGTANFGSLSDGTITITGFVDEDNMSSDSATLLPTQQSVKAYVDANSFTINNNADNRIITGTATAGTLNAETTLTYGTTGADLHITGGSIGGVPPILRLEDVGSSGKLAELNHIAGTTTLISRNATSNGVIKFAGHNGTSETEYARIDSSGNVGINTTHPDSKLDVTGGDITVNTTGTGFMNFKYNNGSTGTIGTDGIDLKITASADLQILPTGNVGIGTNSPSEKLHVNSGTANTVAKFTSSDSKAFIVFTDNATSNFVATGAEGNNLVFYNGTERARIDSSGRLGLGTTNPTYSLDVSSSSVLTGRIQSSSGETILELDNTNTNGRRFMIISGGNSGSLTGGKFGVYDATAGATRLAIDSSGNVGIGLTAPSAKLQVTGNTLVSDDGTNDFVKQSVSGNISTLTFGNTEGTAGQAKWEYTRGDGKFNGYIGANSAINFMTVKGTGQVGIGTTNPQVELHVEDASGNCIVNIESATTGYSALNLGDTNNDDVGQIKYDNSNNSMQFTTNASEAMRLDSSGSVGIGTTSPAAKLEVSGGALKVTNAGNASIFINANAAGSDAAIYFEEEDGVKAKIEHDASNDSMLFTDGAYTETMTLKGAKVGIGTTLPTRNLTVHGGSGNSIFALQNNSTGSAAGDGFQIQLVGKDIYQYNYDDGFMAFGTNNAERLRLISNGNFGIGTTSPSEKLHVVGNAEISGNIETSTFLSTGNATVEGTLTSEGLFTTDNAAQIEGIKSSSTNPIATIKNKNSTNTNGTYLDFVDHNDNFVCSIGTRPQDNTSNSFIIGGSGTYKTGLKFLNYTTYQAIYPATSDGATTDNTIDLGYSSGRFQDIYATNGTIQTSDRNEKQDIQALTEAEQRVATACKGLIRRFRWQDAVEKKDNNPDSDLTARYHFGVMAQDLQDAFTAEGLDAGDYGMFISSTWTDDEGNEQTRLGVRYNELLAFIITTL